MKKAEAAECRASEAEQKVGELEARVEDLEEDESWGGRGLWKARCVHLARWLRFKGQVLWVR